MVLVNLVGTKRCAACLERRYVSQFSPNKRNRDGLQSWCFACTRARKKAARQTGIGVEAARVRNAAWREANKDRKAQYAKEWLAENRDRHRTTARAYRAKNIEKVRAREREQNKRPHIRALRYMHVNLRRAREASARGEFTLEEWESLKTLYGHRCLRCGRREDVSSRSTKLTIDHVVPLSRGGTNELANIQPLCGFCNTSKGAKIADYRPASVHSEPGAEEEFEETYADGSAQPLLFAALENA